MAGNGGNGGSIVKEFRPLEIVLKIPESGTEGTFDDDYFPYAIKKISKEGKGGKAGKTASKCKVDEIYHAVDGCY